MATKMVDGREVPLTQDDLDQIEADRIAAQSRPPRRRTLAELLERLTPLQRRKLFEFLGADYDALSG